MNLPTSPRLRFRFATADDLPLVFELQSDEETMRYIRPPDTDINVVRERVEKWLDYTDKCPGLGVFILENKQDGAFVGYAVARHVDFDPLSPELEVGYTLHKTQWGKGFASELVAPLCSYLIALTDTRQIIAFTDPANVPSQRVLTKNGFVESGTRNVYGGECTVFLWRRP
jgi:[ribosomal protein S5]-alanine N-acetyltransferase